MPFDQPQSSDSEPEWAVNGHYNSTSVTAFQIKITVESPSTASEGDALLQELVDLLVSRYYNVTGFKTYSTDTHRDMLPS